MTIDFESSFYFHREGPGLLMGMSDPHEKPGFSVETTEDWIPGLMEVVRRRAPRIADAGIRGGWAGLYEMTPDHNAIIGEAAGVSRFLYATGFSGHGFLQAPAVGEILRDLVLRRPPFVDIYAAWRRSASTRLRYARSTTLYERSRSSPELTERPMTNPAQHELSVSSTDELRSRARRSLENCGVDLPSLATGQSRHERALADHRRVVVRSTRRRTLRRWRRQSPRPRLPSEVAWQYPRPSAAPSSNDSARC